jgi:hypothetical protein
MAEPMAVQSWWGYDEVVKKLAIELSLVMCFSLIGNAGASAVSAPKPGSKCSVLKTVKTVDKKSFTCISSNGKKVWSKGSLVKNTKKPSVGNSSSSTLNPGAVSNPSPSASPSPSTGARKKVAPSYVFSSSGMSANKIKAGESVEVTFRLTTDDPTVSTPTAVINNVTGHVQATLVSGDKSSGFWSATLASTQSTFAGNYRVYLSVVGYANGDKNEESLTVGNLEVSGVTKSVPNYLFSAASSIPSSAVPGSKITVEFNLSSDDPTVSIPTVVINRISGHVTATLVSGNKTSGRWRAELTIPENTFAGSYSVYLFVMGYANGEKNDETLTLGDISISGPTKLVPFYRFSGVSINKTKVSPGDSVAVTFEHTSNDSTAEAPYAYIDEVVAPTQATSISGTNMSGTWSINFQVPADAFAGTYSVVLLGMGYANDEKNDDRINVGSVTIE